MTRTLGDRVERALELVREAAVDHPLPGVLFAEVALVAARDAQFVDDLVRLMREAQRRLAAVSEPDCRECAHALREARQILTLPVEVEV